MNSRLFLMFWFVLWISLAATAATSPEDTFINLKGAELVVQYWDYEGNPILGMTIFEKSDGSTICQKSGYAGAKPAYSYSCYTLMSGNDSQNTYANLVGAELRTNFQTLDGARLTGSQIIEKQSENMMCRRQSAGVDVSTYQCYQK